MNEGTPDVDAIKFCYMIRKALDKYFYQWRIVVTPNSTTIKLQINKGDKIYDEVISSRDIEYSDWTEILSYHVLAYDFVDLDSILDNTLIYA